MANDQHCPFAASQQENSIYEIQPGTWAITRFADVRRVLVDHRSFSAKVTDNNDFALFGPSPVQDELDRIMVRYRERPALMRVDPPDHGQVRDVVSRVLTPSRVKEYEPRILELVDALIDAFAENGEVEFVSAFAAPLPSAVTAGFLSGEPEMGDRYRFWSGEITSRLAGPQPPERQIEVATNLAEMGDFFLGRIAQRRARPTGDLISLIATARDAEGGYLDDEKIVNVIETFMVGGNDTTTFLLGQSLLRLANDSNLTARLRVQPALIPSFVEEMLRLESPAQGIVRKAVRDVEIDGVTIPAGGVVMVDLASVNRDPAAFKDADELRLDRPAIPRHVAFGYGNHSCIGLNLARAEARIAIAALVSRFDGIELGRPPVVEWISNDFLRGPTRLPLRFRAGRPA